jgi:hypothetical protein
VHSIISLRTGNLDLSFLRKDFCENGQLLLGHFDMEDYFDEEELEEMGHDKMGRVLNAMAIAFKNEFDLDGVDEALAMLFDAVAAAYKKFLVVKACEAKALLVSNANPSTNPWLEKCCVSKVVDVLWHTHLMRPQHYLETCSALLGHVGVIDHDPGYVSPCLVAGSTFYSKQQKLYLQEKLCIAYYIEHCIADASTAYDARDAAYDARDENRMEEFVTYPRDTEEWLEMAYEGDLYHDVSRAQLFPTARSHVTSAAIQLTSPPFTRYLSALSPFSAGHGMRLS